MRIPEATYRIQFTPEFGFKDAMGIVDYLYDLGGPWIYASPIFAARKGSAHGYDVVDPGRLNPALGTDADFDELIGRLENKDMYWIQDIVPNHMAYSGENPMLADLFELGRTSRFFDHFDIWWNHPAEAINGRVAAPFLGDRLRRCLERGEIRPVLRSGTLGVVYYEHFFPMRLVHYDMLDPSVPETKSPSMSGAKDRLTQAVRDVVDSSGKTYSSKRDHRIRRAKATIHRLWKEAPEVREFIRIRLKKIDPETGGPDAGIGLGRLLSKQVYCLRPWQSASREINYRRFFDINELICLRQERPEVFEHSHRLLKRLINQGRIHGVRVDHIDGLCDPHAYLKRLRGLGRDLYLVVEKILTSDEQLPLSWPVEGTSGYEFSDRVTRLFCHPDATEKLTALYEMFSGRKRSFEDVCRAAKRQLLRESFAGDLDNLVRSIRAESIRSGLGAATDPQALEAALTELLSRFPVYRTYLQGPGIRDGQRRLIETLVQDIVAERPDLTVALQLIRNCLLKGAASKAPSPAVSRFQALSAPLTAKGVEDTALYRFVRLISLNDVGGMPDPMNISLNAFHDFLTERMKAWPHTMNTLSTHDSKRSEDVRARVNVLSEIPDEWHRRCAGWRTLNRGEKRFHEGQAVPGGNVEYLLYQTLVGTFPFNPSPNLEDYENRIHRYMIKAVREAKEHTSWHSPDTGYEEALGRFIRRLLRPKVREGSFLADFEPFAEKVARFGAYNALSQTVIKITAPGVPDIYQGNEVFDFSLVDPDNRRPVDFGYRKRLLREFRLRPETVPPRLVTPCPTQKDWDRLKLYVTTSALHTRRQYIDVFQRGRYEPVSASGRFADHVIAYARIHQRRYVLVAVARWLTRVIPKDRPPLGAAWLDTALILPKDYPANWTGTIAGKRHFAKRTLPLKTVFGAFPAAVLLGEVS